MHASLVKYIDQLLRGLKGATALEFTGRMLLAQMYEHRRCCEAERGYLHNVPVKCILTVALRLACPLVERCSLR